MYIHKEGHVYCVVATVIYIALSSLLYLFLPPIISYPFIFLLGLLWFWVFWFFRIPNRKMTIDDNAIVCPCDGKVVVIEETEETEYYKDKRIQISIFMSPLNVHVNRYPISGNVAYVKYHKGKYLVAWHPKSSTENERSTIVIENHKISILARQIAGAVARRIMVYAKENNTVSQNEELGFIKFGSRVDVFLPLNTNIKCKIGDVVKGGHDILATISL